MAEEQLPLFQLAKPLLERFGRDFFKKAPKTPGVYIMSGDAERVLYVGQTKNLRARLGFYKNARPGAVPRKIERLIFRVQSITWETCPSPVEAQLKENELLRVHRPRYNVANTQPQTYSFFGWRIVSGQVELQLSMDPPMDKSFQWHGAFKNRSGCRQSFMALCRLLWARKNQPTDTFDYPVYLNQALNTFTCELPESSGKMSQMLSHFFEGRSAELLGILTPEQLPSHAPSLRAYQEGDIALLDEFFKRGAKRNFLIRQRRGLDYSLIPQNQLDDLIVMDRAEGGYHSTKAAP